MSSNERDRHSDEMVEQAARIIDPAAWEVMDSHLKRMLDKYRGENILYDRDAFKHKPSMAKARAILAVIGGAQ